MKKDNSKQKAYLDKLYSERMDISVIPRRLNDKERARLSEINKIVCSKKNTLLYHGKAAVKRFNRKKHKRWDYEWDRDEDFI